MIPRKFSLMGVTYKVKVVPVKDWPDDETIGFCNLEEHVVSIFGGMSDVEKQQTFCHELVHAILDRMGEHDLNGNEKFVDVFGSLLHQAWSSCK